MQFSLELLVFFSYALNLENVEYILSKERHFGKSFCNLEDKKHTTNFPYLNIHIYVTPTSVCHSAQLQLSGALTQFQAKLVNVNPLYLWLLKQKNK